MDSLHIPSTKSTPEVHFDGAAHLLKIEGESYPENAFMFYEPILKWAGEYLDGLDDGVPVRFELYLPYINTSSTKCFMMLLEKFEEAHQEGKQIAVVWYYNEDNENELECAEEFKEDLSLPFDIIPKDGEE